MEASKNNPPRKKIQLKHEVSMHKKSISHKQEESFLGLSMSFNVEDARRFGIKSAYAIQVLLSLLQEGSPCRKIHEGRPWIRANQLELSQFLLIWSKNQAATVMENMRFQGILERDRFNEKGTDLTYWYTLNDELLRRLS